MKNIILTGSSSGFGLDAVKVLASKGHTVFATMRNINNSNANTAAEIKKWALANNAKVEIVELDVTSNYSVKKAIAEISRQTGGKIDVLINNAGVSFMGLGETLSIDQTEYMYQVNTIGPERVMKSVLPFMHKIKEGLVINITSVQSRNFMPVFSTYNGTKAALDAVSVGYYYELKPSGIDVVTIQPGGYPTTDIVSKSIKAKNIEVEKNYHKDILKFKASLYAVFEPREDSGNPKEVADAMLALVEMPNGSRPIWTVVGGGLMSDSVQQINEQVKSLAEGSYSYFSANY